MVGQLNASIIKGIFCPPLTDVAAQLSGVCV